VKHALAFALAASALLAGAAHAVDVYKWTDSQGVVHYGDRPASGVATTTLSVPGNASAQEQAAANARLAQDRAKLAEPADVGASASRERQKNLGGNSCAEAWRQYDVAAACFNANRTANRKGVSANGTATCSQVPEPTCAR